MSSAETTSRLFRSSGAATFSQVWRSGVTLLVWLVLRRLVPPADWGLYEWALAVFMILGAFRDVGFVYHIVRLEKRPYGNLLAVEAGWGSLLTLMTLIGAPALAWFLKEPHPQDLPVIRALGLFLLFDGLASVPRVYFDAELKVGRTVLPEILRNLLFAALSVGLALAGTGVWSLVIAQVAATGYYAAHLWLRAWGEIPLVWEKGKTLGLVKASLPLASIWFLAVFVQHVDWIVLGRHVGNAVIGHYGFAYKFAFLVSSIIVPAMTRTVYPAFVAFKKEPAKLLEVYRLGTIFVLACEVPAAAFLFVNPQVLQLVGGSRWDDSVLVLLMVLCFAPLIDPFSRLGGELLKAHHKDKTWNVAAATTLASFAGFGWLFTARFGAAGMAWANFIQLGGLVMGWTIYRMAPPVFLRLLRDLIFVYLVPIVPFAAARWLGGESFWLRSGLSVVAAALSVAVYYWRFGQAFVEFFRGRKVPVTETSPG